MILGATAGLLLMMGAAAQAAPAETKQITTPRQAYGFDIGDDYQLANYTQLEAYWKTLDAESDRMQLTSIGETAEGRPQYMAIVSSPENMRQLDRYRDIARRLAKADGLTEEQARALAAEGKAIVWIDGGLHSTEVVGAQQITQILYEMVSGNDAETLRFLDDIIMLFVHANPDGTELVSNWYMREKDPAQREMEFIPRLYQKYVGHDNNRDFYMANQPENVNINRVLYREWFPQIVFNHHQPGPGGAIVFMPTFRDPYNYNLDPLAITGLDGVGAAMHARLISEGKQGTARRSMATYSNWTNATLRSTALFHNSIGILTEIVGSPTPYHLPLVVNRQLANGDLPMPVEPQVWHFRQSIDYSMSMNRAVLDFASRNRETVLHTIYRMGRNSIEKGSRDSWTITPKRIAALQAAAKDEPKYAWDGQGKPGAGRAPDAVNPELFKSVLRNPANRDPRGYILPADQEDFPTAVAFINALIRNGVDVLRATQPFSVGDRGYPAGSFIVQTAQAYRPTVLDMFEPQDHPNDFPYPGGPPIPPYDVSGYTLALQMGVKFDRILEGFDGPFEKLPDQVKPAAGSIVGSGTAGYLVSHAINNTFILQNRLLARKADVYWLTQPVQAAGKSFAPGAIWIPAHRGVTEIVGQAVKELGFDAYALDARPSAPTLKLKAPRVAVVDVYGGNMPAGWIRWLFEQFEFPYTVIYPQRIDAGKLAKDFDVVVFGDDVVPKNEPGRPPRRQPAPDRIPREYRAWLGTITAQKSVPALKAFVEGGGTVIAIGSSTDLGEQLGLPVHHALVETDADGTVKPLPREKFFVPGAILANHVDPAEPLAYGMPEQIDMYFYNSPAFRAPPAGSESVRAVSWFPGPQTLRSGWAWGQERLDGASSILEAALGDGKVFLMATEVAQRAQAHGTFKFLFNGVLYGPASRGMRLVPTTPQQLTSAEREAP